MINLKGARDLEKMRRAGAIAAKVAREIAAAVAPGVTTKELDRITERRILAMGGLPGFKGLYGFPASACISINNEIVHGVPSMRQLAPGDIVSVDIGVVYRGWCSDMAFTVGVGEITPVAKRLLETTERALEQAIKAALPGNHLGDVGAAVEAAAVAQGFSVVRDYGGHGIGRRMHEEPWVANYGQPGTGVELVPGMTLALEPMLAVGGPAAETVDTDGWPVVVTADGTLAAHFEHTVVVTADGPRILTLEAV